MAQDFIRVRGARQHNLKNVDVDIPRHKLVVLTGVSGSGKSSLAFDTLYAEGQRRYVQSLSAYARQFLDQLEKPDVDFIEGLSPAVAIEQVHSAPNPRSTIATVTEIYDYLRVLYAIAGQPHDPETGERLIKNTPAEIGERLLSLGEGTRVVVLSPQPPADGAALRALFEKLRRQGFVRVRLDGEIVELEEELKPSLREEHRVEIVVDRLVIREGVKARLMESIEAALRWNESEVQFLVSGAAEAKPDLLSFTTAYANPRTGYVIEKLTPQHFSFNTHLGACPTCEGVGTLMAPDPGLLVPDGEVSIQDGAVKTWWSRNPKLKLIHQRGVEALAKHFGVAVDAPFRGLPQGFKEALFHGTGDKAIPTGWATGANKRSLAKPYEGLLNEARRLYENAESDTLRAQLTRYMNPLPCPACEGKRLRKESLAVVLASEIGAREEISAQCAVISAQTSEPKKARGKTRTKDNAPPIPPLSTEHGALSTPVSISPSLLNIHYLCSLPIRDALIWVRNLSLTEHQRSYVEELQKEILKRLDFLEQVGLGYLALNRESGTLSGGEMQRIRLATQIGAGLAGVLYVLDEPSIGLHPADTERLIGTLLRLRDLGNTVLVVEHDEAMMRAADHVIEMGPAAGVHGGQLIAQGTPEEVMAMKESLTGAYLSEQLRITPPSGRVAPIGKPPSAATVSAAAMERSAQSQPGKKRTVLGEHFALRAEHPLPTWLTIHDAIEHNLKHVTASFPVGCLTAVTGPSGSGKSTLINRILMRALQRHFYHAKDEPGRHGSISGIEAFDKVVVIDQSPIGRSPRSNPATYTAAFGPIRELYSNLPLARVRGYEAGRFSFNVAGGRCEKCQGDGQIKIDMHFLADVYVTCDHCHGKRYNAETLEITFKGRNIAEVLEMTVSEASRFFGKASAIAEKLRTLEECGLGYVRLGQAGNTLSGGEAQRIKLSAELARKATGNTLYVLDEPTTGLHFADIQTLLQVLFRLRDAGNTVIVIEHHLDVIRCADWVVDLGPGGGNEGGHIVAEGTPEEVAKVTSSATGRFLNPA
ncbi:excinuclease ABC subunit A [Prosthecobacter fusiformis]|uniref:UvrABC system protein A n=1 Tax=Prosthecobacter fusiformis TaxID=48464 RepID=A0A4R7RP82_9BACT|nr:excinuclease ABC subunit UvrA [Prosthecobacter fusiformis]TDU67232.1 excinuclease ABC subunit A [Prosthecobacter fusiformis]